MIIKNNIIPFKGYIAMAIYPFIFVRREYGNVSERTIRHEKIHFKQQKECLIVGFYILYLIMYLWNLIKYKGDANKAYHCIPYEKEAYAYQNNIHYNRRPYAWIKMI